MKYQWPASRLSVKEMSLLFKARLVLKKPITKLVAEAIHKTYNEEELDHELDNNTGKVSK